MKEQLIQEVQRQMLPYLNNAQLKQLQVVLEKALTGVTVHRDEAADVSEGVDTVSLFITAKRIEGCSEKTLNYYRQTIFAMLSGIGKLAQEITTEDLRQYLTDYQTQRKSSKVTIDNIRRILSSYFSWMEDEDYIVKSPVRRIHKVKTAKVIKETYSDETLEIMRDNCCNVRDLAMIDLLASSGMRVGEMVTLNRDDINFNERECVVFGKGSKERIVYFDARTKIHLQNYLESRTDTCSALFVSLTAPHDRLQIGGVERRLRELGKRLNLPRVHPHKFRRTLATSAIDKGMPIEQVQQLLGHQKIDTTMRIGAEYSILDNHISFGLLSTTRFGGHRTYAEGMAAVNFRPLSALHITLNGSVSNMGSSVGAILNVCAPGFNLFFGTDYFATKYSKQFIPINHARANFCFGINFTFGKKHEI